MTDRRLRAELEANGFVVLRSWFDAGPLSDEFDSVEQVAFADDAHRNASGVGNTFRYVPVMAEDTPVSIGLTRSLATVAADLLGCPVLPGRTKITTYFGSTDWHRDSRLPLRTLGMVAYLEPLDASNGALRVVPGSHRWAPDAAEPGADPLAGIAVPTAPGDVIVFDERLLHASSEGTRRRQWRADFVAADADATDDLRREYFASSFSPDWDGGYDVDRFPSYGPHWRSVHPEWAARLDALGVLAAAQEEEDAARARRRSA